MLFVVPKSVVIGLKKYKQARTFAPISRMKFGCNHTFNYVIHMLSVVVIGILEAVWRIWALSTDPFMQLLIQQRP